MREESVVVLGWEGRTKRNAPHDVAHASVTHARERAVGCGGHVKVGAFALVAWRLADSKRLRLRDRVRHGDPVLNVEHAGDTLGVRWVEVW